MVLDRMIRHPPLPHGLGVEILSLLSWILALHVARCADPRVGVAVRPVRGSSDVACRASRVLRVRCVAPIPEGTWCVHVTKLSVKFLFVLAPLGDIHDL
mgnify:CR=1 FL=1